jgi:manganese/zinc/iron transport system permease protein
MERAEMNTDPAAASPWLEFFSFSSVNALYVLFGCLLLGLSAGVLGCFAFLRKRSLLGDTLAHAALPGVCGAFLLTGTKDPLVILLGATASCWLGAVSVDLIVRYTRCKEESALGMVLSVYFGAGILMLTHIQGTGTAAQSGLDKFLFGQAASLVGRDLWVLGGVSALLLTSVLLLYKEFKVLSFDPGFAAGIGLRARSLELFLATLIVLAVAVGLQAVGVVLMAALLVTPAAAARYWTNRLGLMLVLAGAFGAVSGMLGAYVSYASPRMPTGPWMVMAVSFLFAVSLLLAPERGVAARMVRLRRFRRQTAEENILRTLYVLGEKDNAPGEARSIGELSRYRPMSGAELGRTLARLARQGAVRETEDGRFALTSAGQERAERLTRLHRLWELYLARKLELAPDHVHDDAEEIEHIITPELEEQLVAALESPEQDPHARRIPQGEGAA